MLVHQLLARDGHVERKAWFSLRDGIDTTLGLRTVVTLLVDVVDYHGCRIYVNGHQFLMLVQGTKMKET